MKDSFKKVYPILLPILCIIAGVLSFIFFFCGPIAKGNYDVLAIGCLALALSLISIIVSVAEYFSKKRKKK